MRRRWLWITGIAFIAVLGIAVLAHYLFTTKQLEVKLDRIEVLQDYTLRTHDRSREVTLQLINHGSQANILPGSPKFQVRPADGWQKPQPSPWPGPTALVR
jgi:hypothetical protein